MPSPPNDVYRFQHAALRPLLPNAGNLELTESCIQIQTIGEQKFLDFLLSQGLGPMWIKLLRQTNIDCQFSTVTLEQLHASRVSAAASYLLQSHAIKKTRTVLDAADVPHVVFKGTHVREQIYADPSLRPAQDIDLLVSKTQQVNATRALVNAGFNLFPKAKDISHEVTLYDGKSMIDLHWDILRPGRTRTDMTDALLETRKDFSTHWGLNNETTLFLMLVHPVFTKYATTPQSTLIRVVDLAHWIKLRQPDWEGVYSWLQRAGTRVAAWIMLEWLHQLTQIDPPHYLLRRVRPSGMQLSYLRYWITQDLPSRFIDYPFFIKTAFTLPAHDNLSDALRAVGSLIREKRSATTKMKELESAVLG